MTVLIILGILFVALVIIVPLLERSKVKMSDEQMSKLGRWVLPLLAVMLIAQLFMHYGG
ncbi:MAG: hypothetical protein ACI965_001440 [Paraglaciecola sp.]|jgi:hypothetical protein